MHSELPEPEGDWLPRPPRPSWLGCCRLADWPRGSCEDKRGISAICVDARTSAAPKRRGRRGRRGLRGLRGQGAGGADFCMRLSVTGSTFFVTRNRRTISITVHSVGLTITHGTRSACTRSQARPPPTRASRPRKGSKARLHPMRRGPGSRPPSTRGRRTPERR